MCKDIIGLFERPKNNEKKMKLIRPKTMKHDGILCSC